ncbi:hypothetical protein ACFJGW_00725 [Burkholderiaceae bacterium UC74_6]
MARTTAYSPFIDSPADRVCQYFVINGDEELTVIDIATKFSIEADNSVITNALIPCVKAGYLVSEVKGGKHWRPITHYSRGPHIQSYIEQRGLRLKSSDRVQARHAALNRREAGTKPTMSVTDAIMEQAQVFASSWSLVGGPFAAENQLYLSDLEKTKLRKMVDQAVANGGAA